jgi:16S rRNA (cytosine967-C5)-methyltransferase
MGELMRDEGHILANDLHEHKAKLIADQAARLGLESITTVSGDALELGASLQPESFDRILLDPPQAGSEMAQAAGGCDQRGCAAA